jgi:hypothetical protein
MLRSKILFLSLFFSVAFLSFANAQQGFQVSLWGGPQFVALVNVDDYINSAGQGIKLNRLPTYRFGGGVDAIYNFANNYGVQSGIYYSQQGQKYDGFVDKLNGTFTSHIYMNYIRVPLMFRFNSDFDDDNRMNLSIFGGMQLGFLRDVQEVVTNPASPDTVLARMPNFDFKQLYKNTDFGLGMGAQFNIRITSRVSTMLGLRYDRSFSTIENKDYVLPRNAPEEYRYPVSTIKGIGGTDNSVRRPTRISAVNLYTGLTFRFGSTERATAPEITE